MIGGVNGNTIPAIETQNVPRLISTPREDFQFVFEGLARQRMTKPQFPEKIS